jgi:hypothetical protein
LLNLGGFCIQRENHVLSTDEMWTIAEQWHFMHAQSCRGLGNSYTELALCLNLSVNYNADLCSVNFSILVISNIVYIATTFCVVPHLSEGYQFNISWSMYWGLFRPPMCKSIVCTCWAFCVCDVPFCHVTLFLELTWCL